MKLTMLHSLLRQKSVQNVIADLHHAEQIDFSNVEVEPLFEDMVDLIHSASQISVL